MPDGYGEFFTGEYKRNRHGKNVGIYWRANRWIYAYENGPIPAGLIVRHSCDNPPCVRLEHLVLGTFKDNSADRDSRGRAADRHGDLCPTSKLTTDQVLTIRARVTAGELQRDLVTEYGVTKSCISAIVTRKTWTHV